MALPTTTQLQELLDELTDAWRAGNGQGFGAGFTDSAHFVAFDGTVLEGLAAIAEFHQAAFDRHLQNTRLVISVTGTYAIDESALLVFMRGGIESKSGAAAMLTGDSVQTMVVVLQDGKARAQAFQNTRNRPITDGESAGIWLEFDRLWSQRNEPSAPRRG
jgi:uncharacterized protein (TIGR02246 family)